MKKLIKLFSLLIVSSFIAFFVFLALLVLPVTIFSHDNAAQVTVDILKSRQTYMGTNKDELTNCLKQINPSFSFINGLFFPARREGVIKGFKIYDDLCVSVKFDLQHNGDSWVIQKVYR